MLFDSHCHLIHKSYKRPSEEVIKNAEEVGVNLFLHVGTSLKENEQAIELAEKHNNVFCAIGIYPHEDKNVSLEELEKSLRGQIKKSKKIVAIGETGMDRSSPEASERQVSQHQGRSLEQQLGLFEMQAKLAVEFNLPLIIHNRNGDEQVLEVLGKYFNGRPPSPEASASRGVCHCFVQDWDYAQKMLNYGFYLSFGGIITYPPSSASRRTTEGQGVLEVVKRASTDRILVETDSPYLAPGDLRDTVNEPKNIGIIAQKIAEVRGISYDKVCKLTYENGKRLFKIDALNKPRVD